MVWHRLTWHPLEGPLDPEEMAGGYDDAECFHDEMDDDNICTVCGEEIE